MKCSGINSREMKERKIVMRRLREKERKREKGMPERINKTH